MQFEFAGNLFPGCLIATFGRIVLLWLLLTTCSYAESSATNIILIVSDNQSAELLGTYGNDNISTPSIDRLADEGIRFENAFSVSGVCSPTRAAIFTGLMPSQTGIHVAFSPPKDIPDWSAIEEYRSLPQTLSDAGYRTALIGKYHLGQHDEAQLGFDHWVTFTSGHTTAFEGVPVIDNGKHYRSDKHLTDFWTDKAVEYINQQDSKQPFFLFLAYNGPYMLPPTVNMAPTNRHAQFYRDNPPDMPQEPVHAYLENWARGKGPTESMVNQGTTAWHAIRALNNRTAIINTASETSMVDDGVGRVMEALKQRGLEGSTLVIYTSDQGASFGHHGIWGNTSWTFPFIAYDINMHIPLIFRQPGRIPQGMANDRVVSQVDLFRTLLDYIGLGRLEIANSPGRSLVPFLDGDSVDSWRDEAFFEFVTVRVIRTLRWKYMKRFDDTAPDSLFDLRTDSGEHQNLIDDPAFRDVIHDLDDRLTKHFERFSLSRHDIWHGGTAKGRLLEPYGKNHIFSDRFPDWRPPYFEKASKPFRDVQDTNQL